MCLNGQCINSTMMCDNERSCFDWSDEYCGKFQTNKDDRRHTECNLEFQFDCKYYCVPKIAVRDSKWDCLNKEDEQTYINPIVPCVFEKTSLQQLKHRFFFSSCKKKSCPYGYYLCRREHYCIPIDVVCDGIKQCYLGDDEINCGKKSKYF